MVFYGRASGSRLHANYFRPGGVHQDLPQALIDDIAAWCDPFLKTVDDIDVLLTDRHIVRPLIKKFLGKGRAETAAVRPAAGGLEFEDCRPETSA